MKKVIHVNQHKIKSNTKNLAEDPVITCKTYNKNYYGHEVLIFDDRGKISAKIIYSPDSPLSCGARVWIETEGTVEIKDRKNPLSSTVI